MDNEEYRFGSAAWTDQFEVARAGLFGGRGQQFGYLNNKALTLDTDAPSICVAGAGSGKLRDRIALSVARNAGERNMVLDPRGEIARVTEPAFAFKKAARWTWNPAGLVGLPQHRCNPLDILELNNPRLVADCKFVAEGLVPISHSSNGRYFSQRANDWGSDFLLSLVERNGSVDFPALYQLVTVVEAEPAAWADHAEFMLSSRFSSVRRTAGEMLAKQQDAPREFGGIIGELYNAVSALSDPMLRASLKEPDFSVKALCDRQRACSICLNVPMEYMGIWAPILRVFFTAGLLIKMRAPEANRVNLVVDEAGQLGSFDALLRAFTYGRGAGVRAEAYFQDVGQIVRSFGQPGLQGFMGSAALRQFFGVRDYETAKMVSDMLGTETLEYDDELRQSAARRSRFNAAASIMNGGDPFAAIAELQHQSLAHEHRTKQARSLMTADEILAMPEDRQIVFVSGKNLKPIYAHKLPYWTRSEFAGKFLPNPYHPPSDTVLIVSGLGQRRARVIRERVPHAFAHLPQYQSGEWAYVKGHRPR
ncbi:MAG: type IV secretory system conjugative DNA transfer family protein [Pseudomonadota bacterium]